MFSIKSDSWSEFRTSCQPSSGAVEGLDAMPFVIQKSSSAALHAMVDGGISDTLFFTK
jgi:hypothetical protein